MRFLQGRDDRVKAAIDDQAWILEDAKPSRAEALDYGIGNMALFTWFDEALFGITFGGIGERTGTFPTEREYDNVARALEAASQYAKKQGLQFGIEPVNRYENHLINTGWQAVEMIERVGSENLFVHLDTYHMNIEEKGAGNGILDAREHLKYIHLSESDRGTPGAGTCDWDEIFSTLSAIGFKGGLAMESFINMPPEIAFGLSVWRPVAKDFQEVMDNGLPFLRNKAAQYRLLCFLAKIREARC